MFKGGTCFASQRSYCCPTPASLTGCQWVTKTDSSGVDSDCANAVCNATQVEVLRASVGGDGTLCACGSSSHLATFAVASKMLESSSDQMHRWEATSGLLHCLNPSCYTSNV